MRRLGGAGGGDVNLTSQSRKYNKMRTLFAYNLTVLLEGVDLGALEVAGDLGLGLRAGVRGEWVRCLGA